MNHDLQTERAALGVVLLSEGAALDEIMPILGSSGEAFYEPAHRAIYAAMVKAHRPGTILDALRIAEALGPNLEGVGGYLYLGELMNAVPTSTNAAFYAGRVRGLKAMRDLDAVCRRISASSQDAEDPGAILEEAEREIFRLTQTRGQDGEPSPLSATLPDAVEFFRAMANPDKREGVDGLPTGVPGLDALLGGLRPGEMIVVGARPGCGKTCILLGMAAHLAKRGNPCLFFSLEMDRGQIARRLISMAGNADPRRAHWLQGGGLERAERAAKDIEPWPLWIDDAPRRSVWDIRGIARRWKSRHGGKPCAVFVDYLQLCQLERRPQKLAQRYVEIGEISHSLKALARELECPVVVACQLSRSAENESDGFRMLACLRESGDIEADADAAIILSALSEKDRNAIGEGADNVIRLTLAKHRHGGTGKGNLFFDKPIQTFRALTTEPAPARRASSAASDYDPNEFGAAFDEFETATEEAESLF